VERPVIALALTKRSAPNAPSTPSTSVIPIVSKILFTPAAKDSPLVKPTFANKLM
jgi:hypothetical protein